MSTQIRESANPGALYPTVFESPAGLASGGAPSKGGIADRLRDRLVREEWTRLHKRGWDHVEIENYHPWPVRVDLGELGIVAIPAAHGEEPGRVRLDTPRISMRDLGDGNFVPVSVLPSEMAQEVEREYQKAGGIVCHSGGGAPAAAGLVPGGIPQGRPVLVALPPAPVHHRPPARRRQGAGRGRRDRGLARVGQPDARLQRAPLVSGMWRGGQALGAHLSLLPVQPSPGRRRYALGITASPRRCADCHLPSAICELPRSNPMDTAADALAIARALLDPRS